MSVCLHSVSDKSKEVRVTLECRGDKVTPQVTVCPFESIVVLLRRKKKHKQKLKYKHKPSLPPKKNIQKTRFFKDHLFT